jgi:hypothetical protein
MSICSVSNCGRPVIARELCSSHYARARRGVPLDKPLGTKTPGGKPCGIDNCGRKAVSYGLCNAHRMRALAGKPLEDPFLTRFVTSDIAERLRHYAPAGAPDECWEWGRGTNKGYGVIAVGTGKVRQAHVVAWELHHGQPLPTGMVVRHLCDNRPCTNPAHLALGTHADNASDRVEHGQSNKGVDHPHAKLSDEDVVEIRRLYESGVYQRVIAGQFGISQANVSFIVNGIAWDHIN